MKGGSVTVGMGGEDGARPSDQALVSDQAASRLAPSGFDPSRDGTAYYNEIDPFAAAWLRELIKAGHIAPGFVDERDIRDVRPADLAGFVQCHFFAGIGVWSYALRRAGWPDDRPVWTGSCPCPPFSAAGPNFRCPKCDAASPVPNAVRTGAFNCIGCDHEWQADERHLFPEFFRLVRDCRPERVLGEQVASKDGRTWIDIVRASLEMLGYAVGHPDVCAAGFGAPNIRQRLFWVAYADGWHESAKRQQPSRQHRQFTKDGRASIGVGDAKLPASARQREHGGPLVSIEEAEGSGLPGFAACGLGHAHDARLALRPRQAVGCGAIRHEGAAVAAPGPVNGFWRDAQWIGCSDGRGRPIGPGITALAHGAPARLGRLRGYGNAINAEAATGFLEAVASTLAAEGRAAGIAQPDPDCDHWEHFQTIEEVDHNGAPDTLREGPQSCAE